MHEELTAKTFLGILGYQVYTINQKRFSEGNAIFLENKVPIGAARIIKEWLNKLSIEVERLIWPSKSPDLDIIEHLLSILEIQVRSRLPPPSYLKELEGVFN